MPEEFTAKITVEDNASAKLADIRQGWDDLRQTVEEFSDSASGVGSAYDSIEAGAEGAGQAAGQLSTELSDTGDAARALADTDAASGLTSIDDAAGAATGALSDISSSLSDAAQEAGQTSQALDELHTSVSELDGDTANIVVQVETVTDSMGEMSGASGDLGGALSGASQEGVQFGDVLRGAGGAAVVAKDTFADASASTRDFILGLGQGKLVAGGFAGALLGAGMAASEEEAQISRLTGVIEANVRGWNGDIDAVEQVIAGRQRFAFADDALRDSLARLIPITHDVGRAFDVQRTAMDMSRGLSIDLDAATAMLARGMLSGGQSLRRYGIDVKAGSDATEVLAAVQAKFAGQAERYASLTSASLDRVKTSFGNLAETVGGPVSSVIHPVLDMIATDLEAISGVAEMVGGALGTLGGIFGAFGGDAAAGASDAVAATADMASSTEPILLSMGDSFDDTAVRMADAGTDGGQGWGGNLSSGIDDTRSDVEGSVSDTSDAMDTRDAMGFLGEQGGIRYGSGSPGGVAPGIRSTKGDVSNAAAELVAAADKREAMATVGQAMGQALGINIAASAIASAATLGIDITGKKVAAPSGGLMIPNLLPPPRRATDRDYDNQGQSKEGKRKWGGVVDSDYERPYAPGAGPDLSGDKGYGPGRLPEGYDTGPYGYGSGYIPGAGPPTQEQLDAANRPGGANYVPPPKKLRTGGGGTGGGGSSAKAGEKAAKDAERAAEKADKDRERASGAEAELREQDNLRKAHDAVAAAEDNARQHADGYASAIEDLTDQQKKLRAEEEQTVGPMEAALESQKRSLAEYSRESEAALHDLDVQIHTNSESLADMEKQAAQALQPLIEQKDEAVAALEAVRTKTREANQEFDQQAHGYATALYDIEQAEKAAAAPFDAQLKSQNADLEAARAAVEAVNEQYAELTDLQHELSALQQEESAHDHAQQLEELGQTVDNLRARLQNAVPGSQQWLTLQKQLGEAEGERDRKGKQFSVEERIASLEEQKKSDLEAANARVQAAEAAIKATETERTAALESYEARKKQIEEEQALLEHRRAEFNYEQSQKEIAAQREVDSANATLVAAQEAWAEKEALIEAELLRLGELREKRAFADAEEIRTRGLAVADLQERAGNYKTYYADRQKELDDQITKKKDEATNAALQDKAIIDSAKGVEEQLRKAYGVIDQIGRAQKDGAKLTDEQAKSLAAANKTVEEFNPKLSTFASLLKTDVPSALRDAKSATDAFRELGLVPLSREFDGSVAGTLGKRMKDSLDKTLDTSFVHMWNTDFLDATFTHTMNWANKLQLEQLGPFFLWAEGKFTTEVDAWESNWHDSFANMTDDVQKLIDKMHEIPAPPGAAAPPGTEHRAFGGDVFGGRAYIVGESGPELFIPPGDGYVAPNGALRRGRERGEQPDAFIRRGSFAGSGPGAFALNGNLSINLELPDITNLDDIPDDPAFWRSRIRGISIALAEEIRLDHA